MKSKNMIPGGWERERTISLSFFFFFLVHIDNLQAHEGLGKKRGNIRTNQLGNQRRRQ